MQIVDLASLHYFHLSLLTHHLLTAASYALQGEVVTTFTKDGIQGKGYTGVQVWNGSVSDTFQASSITESFLYVSLLDTGEEVLSVRWCCA